MNFLSVLFKSIEKHHNNNAFCINDTFYSYKDFAFKVSSIRSTIDENVPDSEKLIGLITNNDLETYAAIVAFWLEGKAYVPINPDHPIARNTVIFKRYQSSIPF